MTAARHKPTVVKGTLSTGRQVRGSLLWHAAAHCVLRRAAGTSKGGGRFPPIRYSCKGEEGGEAEYEMRARQGVRAQSLCGCALTVKDSAATVGRRGEGGDSGGEWGIEGKGEGVAASLWV